MDAVALYLAALVGTHGWWGILAVIPLLAFGVLIPIACAVGLAFGIAGIVQWFLVPRPRASRDRSRGRGKPRTTT